MFYRNNAGRLGSRIISVCLETHWLGQKSGFFVPERPRSCSRDRPKLVNRKVRTYWGRVARANIAGRVGREGDVGRVFFHDKFPAAPSCWLRASMGSHTNLSTRSTGEGNGGRGAF